MTLWVDFGRGLDRAPAAVSGRDLVLTPRRGCYETLRTYGRVPFLLVRHLARLRSGADALGLAVRQDDAQLSDRVLAAVETCAAETGGAYRSDTEVTVRLTLQPEKVETLLAVFARLEGACDSVSVVQVPISSIRGKVCTHPSCSTSVTVYDPGCRSVNA